MAFLANRTPPERVAMYTRACIYILFGLGPYLTVMTVVFGGRVDLLPGLGLIASSIALCAACILLLRRGIARYLGGPNLCSWVYLAVVASLAATVVFTLVAQPIRLPDTTYFDGDWRTLGVLMATVSVLVALTPLMRYRWLALWSILPAAAGTLALFPTPLGESPEATSGLVIGTVLTSLWISLAYAASARVSVWMIGVVTELEHTRVAHALLAVAEERLRFSRDLHDVVGRTLSAVAVKSELAAELSTRGRPGAAQEMLEVRQIAQNALREVREVVAGYRSADLSAELAGARSVLRSAGIDTTVHGSEAQLAEPVQDSLAWVVREGVTNVVRHSKATRCCIRLCVADGAATLAIVNDGACPSRNPGTGLIGLTERLALLGGELSTWTDADRFGLRVSVPLCASRPELDGRPRLTDGGNPP